MTRTAERCFIAIAILAVVQLVAFVMHQTADDDKARINESHTRSLEEQVIDARREHAIHMAREHPRDAGVTIDVQWINPHPIRSEP